MFFISILYCLKYHFDIAQLIPTSIQYILLFSKFQFIQQVYSTFYSFKNFNSSNKNLSYISLHL